VSIKTMDFSDKNFVDNCSIEEVSDTLTEINCYSAASSFNQVVLVCLLFVLVSYFGYSVIRGK